jgi:arylsulfatase
MITHLDGLGGPESYPIAPVGWALAMNTPHQWTKQVASHLGGTRDGLVVHWPRAITDRGGIREQFHHVIDVLPTILECTGIPHPTSVDGVTQQPIEGVSMRYTFDAPDAPDRRRTQYFEICGNRGIYHDGWTAVTRHGVPWEMVGTGGKSFRDDVWELYDLSTDWSQARDVAAEHPERLAALRELFLIEASKYQVFPLDDRVTERENPQVAGRLDLLGGRRSVTYHGRTRRLTEETTPNVKNTSHTVVADVEVGGEAGDAEGVLVAQGGRFGGWALYCREGRACYVYNFFGLRVHTVRAEEPLTPGRHEVRMDFCYDGGGLGRGGTAVLSVDGAKVASGVVDATVPYYFSFDETFDVGVDLGTPVSEDYPAVGNEFSGTVHTVRIDLREDGEDRETDDGGRLRRVMTSQ